jgi:hypothetical protein
MKLALLCLPVYVRTGIPLSSGTAAAPDHTPLKSYIVSSSSPAQTYSLHQDVSCSRKPTLCVPHTKHWHSYSTLNPKVCFVCSPVKVRTGIPLSSGTVAAPDHTPLKPYIVSGSGAAHIHSLHARVSDSAATCAGSRNPAVNLVCTGLVCTQHTKH